MREIEMDIRYVRDAGQLYDKFAETFGFFEGFGHNANATLDCLTSMIYPEDGLSGLHMREDETLVLAVRGFYSAHREIRDTLTNRILDANDRWIRAGKSARILLYLS